MCPWQAMGPARAAMTDSSHLQNVRKGLTDGGTATVLSGRGNSSVSRERKTASAWAAAGTTGSSRKTAAPEKLPAEGIRSFGKRHQERVQMARREESQRLKAYLSHPLARSAVTRKHPRSRGCLPDDGRSTHLLDPVQQYKGCKAEKGPGRNKLAIAIAAPRSAQQHE